MTRIKAITTTLHVGDPLNPDDTDILIQSGWLYVGDPVPAGWRVMTGNDRDSLVMRVAYRYEVAS